MDNYLGAIIVVVSILLIVYYYDDIRGMSGFTNSMSKIPKVIMQTGPGKNAVMDSNNSWRVQNPEYSYEYYDNTRAVEFISQYYDKDVLFAFNKIKPGAFKADLFRYCYLYIKGGVYIDLDMAPVVRLKDIVKPGYDFISVAEPDSGNICGIYQAFIASVPKFEPLRVAIDRIVEYTKNDIYPTSKGLARADLHVTGPGLLSSAVYGLCAPGMYKMFGYNILLYAHQGFYVYDLNGNVIIQKKGSLFRTPDVNSYGKFYHSDNLYNMNILIAMPMDSNPESIAINKSYAMKYGYNLYLAKDYNDAMKYARMTGFDYLIWMRPDSHVNMVSDMTFEDIIRSYKGNGNGSVMIESPVANITPMDGKNVSRVMAPELGVETDKNEIEAEFGLQGLFVNSMQSINSRADDNNMIIGYGKRVPTGGIFQRNLDKMKEYN